MNDFTVLKQITLPRRPLKQPTPTLVDGGDCGGCCLGGLLGVTLEEAYDRFHRPGTYYGGKPIEQRSSLSRRSMVDTLEALTSDTGCRGGLDGIPVLLDHVISAIPIWPFDQHGEQLHFGMRAQFEWRDYARALLNGGYYGLAQVKHGGWPDDTPIAHFGHTDHWVMICGWRFAHSLEGESPERRAAGLGHYDEQWLIGDSSLARPLETWVEANEFATRWGGFAAIWARPLAT